MPVSPADQGAAGRKLARLGSWHVFSRLEPCQFPCRLRGLASKWTDPTSPARRQEKRMNPSCRKIACAAVTVVLSLAGATTVPALAPAPSASPGPGLDLAGIDRSVPPGAD